MTELMDKVITIYNYCFYAIFIVEAVLTIIFIILKGKDWAVREIQGDSYEAHKAKKDFLTTLFVFIGIIVISVIVYFVILKVFLKG